VYFVGLFFVFSIAAHILKLYFRRR